MTASPIRTLPKVRLKSIALPVEHGGWAFLIEPILIGIFIAPSIAGWWLSFSALGVFLIYQPLKIVIKDHLKAMRYPRTAWAERFTAAYVFIAVVGFIVALLSTQAPIWIPVLLAAPLACLQVVYAATQRGREIIAEIAGAVALSMITPAIVIAAGWTLTNALVLWMIPAGRAITTILYVHTRLRFENATKADNRRLMLMVHVIDFIIVAGLAFAHLMPLLAAMPTLILLGRAWHGLSSRMEAPAKIIGFQELGYGLLGVILVVMSYRL